MARSTFVARRGWTRELIRGPEALAASHRAATELASEIRDNVPVRSGEAQADYGPMQPQLTAEGGTPTWRIPIGSSIWHLLEFGSIHNEAYAPIRRAADAMGLDFESGGPS